MKFTATSKKAVGASAPPTIAPSEAEQIACAQTAAQAVIERHVDAQKTSYPGLPRQSIYQMVTHGNSCVCRVAQHLLKDEKQ